MTARRRIDALERMLAAGDEAAQSEHLDLVCRVVVDLPEDRAEEEEDGEVFYVRALDCHRPPWDAADRRAWRKLVESCCRTSGESLVPEVPLEQFIVRCRQRGFLAVLAEPSGETRSAFAVAAELEQALVTAVELSCASVRLKTLGRTSVAYLVERALEAHLVGCDEAVRKEVYIRSLMMFGATREAAEERAIERFREVAEEMASEGDQHD